MVDENSISIIIPALNEEGNIEGLVQTICTAVERNFDDYEIILFNDGSTDRTGAGADRMALQNNRITVVHNKRPKCVGGVYKAGRRMARMNYLMLINGKNDTMVESLERIFALKGKYDIIIPHTLNIDERHAVRIFFSKAFVWLLNKIFSLNLKYYNHYVLHKRAIVNSIAIRTNSYAFQAEALIKLIHAGYSYVEVGVMDKFEPGVKTKAFKINNVLEVFLFFLRMVSEYFFQNKTAENQADI